MNRHQKVTLTFLGYRLQPPKNLSMDTGALRIRLIQLLEGDKDVAVSVREFLAGLPSELGRMVVNLMDEVSLQIAHMSYNDSKGRREPYDCIFALEWPSISRRY